VTGCSCWTMRRSACPRRAEDPTELTGSAVTPLPQ
jgi:hypothetical protein